MSSVLSTVLSSVSTGHTSRVDDLKDYDDQKEPMCPLWKDLIHKGQFGYAHPHGMWKGNWVAS